MNSLFDTLVKLSNMPKEDFEANLKNVFDNMQSNDNSPKFSDCIQPGNIVDLEIDSRIVHGIILANKALLLVDPETHAVKGYLTDYTEIVPYPILRIRKPHYKSYKYTDESVPVIWDAAPKYVEMTMDEIEKQLGIVKGQLRIK